MATQLTERTSQSTRSASRIALGVVAVAVWGIVAVRAVPGVRWDRGVFVSVSERLLAGDRLYVDVWDNKDPLFFYLLALGRLVHPWADVALELGWIALAAFAMACVCRSLGCEPALTFTVGWIATPLLVTGLFYIPGYTNLPGTAMTLAVLAAALRERGILAGAGLGVLLFLKIVNFPVGVVLVAIVIAERRNWKLARNVAVGLACSAAVMAAVLLLRGELGGYLSMLSSNVAYADGANAGNPFLGHLSRIATVPAAVLSLLLLALLVWGAFWVRSPRNARLLVHLAWGAGISVLVVLAITGMWNHHVQMAYVVACLCLAMVARKLTGWVAIAVVLFLVVLMGGLTPAPYATTPDKAGPTLAQLDAPSQAAQALNAVAPPGSYARFGSNDDFGHAAGLRQWNLACPAFHQYSFDPVERLSANLDCLSAADHIIVSEYGTERLDAAPDRGSPFGEYVDDVRQLIAREYHCRDVDDVRICSRRPS